MEKISIKQRILNAIAAHPNAVTLGISIAIATGLAMAAATISPQHADASFGFGRGFGGWGGCSAPGCH